MSRHKIIFFVIVILVYGAAWLRRPPDPKDAGFVVSPPTSEAFEAPRFESRFASKGSTQQVHAATLVEISGGRLRGFWYGGSREGAGDVAIYTSVFDPGRSEWSLERPVVTRAGTQKHLRRYIDKLGNPVVFRGPDERLWLFYVSVSIGGWSGSAINLCFSNDDGESWGPPRRIVTSPFLNLSTLVKGPALLRDDGTIALPVYHELIGLFGEIVFLDASGDVLYKSRLSRGRSSLQPVIVPSSPSAAKAFMRYAGPPPNRLLSVETTDGGFHWSQPHKEELPNPNAAVACLGLAGKGLLLAFNNVKSGRNDLSLAYSDGDGKSWRVFRQLEPPGSSTGAREEFSYPYLFQTQSGDIHLLYTWQRTHIKHVRFNRAWMERKLR